METSSSKSPQGVSQNQPETVLALDVGSRRIGVARAHLAMPFPAPLLTLSEPDRFLEAIAELVAQERAGLVVIGLPRGMSGQETEQTRRVEAFGKKLSVVLDVPLVWMDEAVTSAKAEAELKSRGKPYEKGDVDALAATYILEDYFREHPEPLK